MKSDLILILTEIAAGILGIYVFVYVMERMERKSRQLALLLCLFFLGGYFVFMFLIPLLEAA